MRLAVRSAPKADETLHAFVLRLATANGHDHPGWILAAAGLGSTFATAPCDLAGLSGLTGGLATVDALARAACWDARGREGRMLLSGKPVAASALALAHARICPACVDAVGTVRALWDLRCVSACPDHDVRLTDRCPRCGRRLGWMRPGPGICPCGAPLGSGGETADPGALSVARAASWGG
ncbi:TniQ family protein [Heyndrickxia sporothermodurans]